jgi:type IV secretion system protein VirD4
MSWFKRKRSPLERLALGGRNQAETETLSAALPRGVTGRSERDQRLPQARWADPEKLAQDARFQFTPEAPFLGVTGAQIASLDSKTVDPLYAAGGQAVGVRDDRHMVLCAGSRAGKGRSVLIPTLLTYRGSVLTLDPKGELANITAAKRTAMGQDVCVLDPFGVTAERLRPLRTGFNPMAGLSINSKSLVVDAGLIADALVTTGEGKDPHWDDSARNFIEGLVLHVATDPRYLQRRSLVSVRDLLDHALDPLDEQAGNDDAPLRVETELRENAERLLASARALDLEIGAALEATASDFYEKWPGERAGVLSTARRQTRFLSYPELRASLASDGLDLRKLKTAPAGMSVYLCLPAGRMGTCNKWFRLFINMMLEAMEREPIKPAVPVLTILEEFHVLGHLQQIEVASGLIAGFGVKLLIVLQDLTQLKRHYKESWETFLGNAGVQVFFGNVDLTTLDYIRQRCGQTSLIVERGNEVSIDQRVQGGSRGASWSVEVRDLLTADEAARLFAREDPQQRALLLCAGQPPAVIQRVKYDRHERFTGLYEPEE